MANEFIARKGLVILENGARITGSSTVVGDITASGNITASNFYGHGQLTGSFTGSFTGDGSQLSGIATTLAFSGSAGSDVVNLKTEALTINGSNGITTTVTDNTVTVNLPSGAVTASSQVYLDLITGTTFSNAAFSFPQDIALGGNIRLGGNEIRNSADQVVVQLSGSSIRIVGSASADNGFVGDVIGTSSWASNVQYANISNKPTLVSASNQVDVRQTTGIETIATTGSNTLTGVQTISNTTNSTTFTDGALVVAGGVGISKDVHVSGSLTVVGLLTATSMSTAYVTSSQYNVGVNKITLNDDDTIRFAGISVLDSGSTGGSGSLFWDSLRDRWIYENITGAAYNSGILIAGPKNVGTLGDEVGLIAGRIPVASGDDHIDTAIASSSIYVDFPSRRTYVEAGLYVTGAVSASTGVWTDRALINNTLYFGSTTTNIGSGTINQVIATLATSSYDSVHFDYVVKDGTNYRTGTVMAIWNDAGIVEYTDTSTNDIGETFNETFAVDVLSGNARLKFSCGDGTWTVKTSIRAL